MRAPACTVRPSRHNEAKANIVIGFAINWTANMVFLPMFGFDTLTAAKAFVIGLVFTLISFVRQYVIRRWFNGLKFGNAEPAR